MLKAFADDLKAIREEKNLSLKTISQQTRLNIVVLENLENGDFNFQPQAYIRAFLKQYVASLGLDVEETLFDYDLARNGKYKAKRINSGTTSPPAENKIEGDNKEERKPVVTDMANEPSPKKKTEPDEEKYLTPDELNKVLRSESSSHNAPIKKVESKTLKTSGMVEPAHSESGKGGMGFFRNLLNSPVVRNIAMILFFILVLLGVYSLVNILFLDGSKDNPEIVRQNFDDVVREQEKKILGKRTPEEIQDSIRKAEELLLASKDSITLKIVAIADGSLFLVTDSVNYSKPDKIEFEKGDQGTFKAGRTFHISSTNTKSFKASVNDIPISFDKTSVSKIRIDKTGTTK